MSPICRRPFARSRTPRRPRPPRYQRASDLQKFLDDIEKQYLEKALAQADGVKLEAAKLLGLTFRSFRYRLKKLLGHEDEITEDLPPTIP